MTIFSLFYAVAVIVAYITSSKKDRLAWLVILAYSCITAVLNVFLWSRIDSPEMIYGYAAVDTLTIFTMLLLVKSQLAIFQSLCLMASCVFHFVLYFDLREGTSIVYDKYEFAIVAICIAQLFPAIDGYAKTLGRIGLRLLDLHSMGRTHNVENTEGDEDTRRNQGIR